MLQALLHGKLAREAFGEDEGLDEALPRREDPLTAIVFGRLRYLPLPDALALIAGAVAPLSGHPWDVVASAPAAWELWRGLSPGVGGHNLLRVEPDVLLRLPDRIVIFEVKHRGDQSHLQWREQLLAVERAWPTVPRTLVAVGGGFAASEVTTLCAELGEVPLFELTWDSFREAVVNAARTAPPHVRALLEDVASAIEAWGYRPSVAFDSLPAVRAALAPCGIGTAALPAFQIGPSSPLPPIPSDPLVLAAARHRPLGHGPLPRWSIK